MKRKCFLGIVILLLLLGSFFVNTHKPTKKEISLPEKEEKVVTVSEALPDEPVKAEVKKEIVSSPAPDVTAEKEVKSAEITQPAEEEIPPEPSSPPQEESPKSEISEPFCTLTVRCDDVLKNKEKLSAEKAEIIPENGFIFPEEKIPFTEGETVFDILKRTLRERNIHMDFVNNAMYKSAYIRGIGNLYEFDCGDTSGWIYTVNGESPLHGCSVHKVKKGDVIEFKYICTLY